MKRIITFFSIALLFVNCSGSDDDSMLDNSTDIPTDVIADVPDVMNSDVMGDFISGAHPTSGKATANKKNELLFTNFKTDNGPKLLVYLSTDPEATAFVNLGDLKGIEGDFTYAIPAETDLSKYNYVNIWCVDFSVSFGHAILK